LSEGRASEEENMFVREKMTANPVTVGADASVPEALALMRERKVRRLPVLDHRGKLVGMVSEKDLLYASPSPGTTLSSWEIPTILAKLKVEKVMAMKVVAIAEDLPLEEAARIMADQKLGGLPVLRDGALVGIITETDVFRALLHLLGGRRSGVRVTASIAGAKGTVAAVAGAVAAAGGDIVGLGMSDGAGQSGAGWLLTLKVQGLGRDAVVAALKPVVDAITDVRES
jgi:acetoin utilization protein AcuB